MNSEFPYGVLGLDKSLDDFRREAFARLEEVHAEYAALGYLPASLNLNRGPARGLIELGNFGRFRLYQDIAALLEQAFPFTAAGKWLDYHAAQILLTRKPALQATGTITFSRKNPGGNVKIPKERLVKTKPDGLGEVYRFVTTAEAVMPEGALSVDVPVIAETYGQASNVTAGAICEIVTATFGVDAVANSADWLLSEGADEEGDASLRQRYILAWRSVGGLNKYFYEGLAMSVAGVDSVQVHDRHPRGQGTVDVIIKGAAGIPTESLIGKVTEVIQADRPQNDDVLVLPPVPVEADLRLCLKITAGSHAAIKLEAENRLRALFEPRQADYGVKLLKIGEDLTRSRIHSECLKISGVKSVAIESPAADLYVPFGGLAVLKNIAVEPMTSKYWQYFRDTLAYPEIQRPGPLALLAEAEAREHDLLFALGENVRDQFLPELALQESVALFGSSRGVPRHYIETDEQYRKRVVQAFAWQKLSGRYHGLYRIYEEYGFPLIRLVELKGGQWAEFDIELLAPHSGQNLEELFELLSWIALEYKRASAMLRRIRLVRRFEEKIYFGLGLSAFERTTIYPPPFAAPRVSLNVAAKAAAVSHERWAIYPPPLNLPGVSARRSVKAAAFSHERWRLYPPALSTLKIKTPPTVRAALTAHERWRIMPPQEL